MKKKIFIAVMLALLASTVVAASTQEGIPVNRITLDVTIDPETGEFSVLGFSADQMRWLGFQRFDSSMLELLEGIESVHLRVSGTEIEAMMNDTTLLTVVWDEESRETTLKLISNLSQNLNIGEMTEAQKLTIEKWIGSSQIDITGSMTSDDSEPFSVHMTTPFQIAVNERGQVIVENFPLDIWLDSAAMDIYRSGGIEGALVCVEGGVLKLQVNGSTLPNITVHDEGFALINEAFELGIENFEPFFDAQLGLEVALDGATFTGATCGEGY